MAEVTKGKLSESAERAKYDPQKIYQWQPEDRFLLTGVEFAQLYQAIKADTFSPGGISAKQKVDVFDILEKVVSAAVEAGVATEVIQKPPIEQQPSANGKVPFLTPPEDLRLQ